VRLVIADWQNARYASNADKKKMLELRLLHLRMLADKKESPQLENEIKYLEKRIDNITHNMREVEESLGYGD
jgi:ribosomal protein S4